MRAAEPCPRPASRGGPRPGGGRLHRRGRHAHHGPQAAQPDDSSARGSCPPRACGWCSSAAGRRGGARPGPARSRWTASIVENGGLFFVRDAKRRLRRVYAEAPAERAAQPQASAREVRRVHEAGARRAALLGQRVHRGGPRHRLQRGRSSWATRRRTGSSRCCARGACRRCAPPCTSTAGSARSTSSSRPAASLAWRGASSSSPTDARFVYAGDSFNDAPMFQAFAPRWAWPTCATCWIVSSAPPAFITRAAEGRGFEELARAILAQRVRAGPSRSDIVNVVKLELARGLAGTCARATPGCSARRWSHAPKIPRRQRGGPPRGRQVRRARLLRSALGHRGARAHAGPARDDRRGLLPPPGEQALRLRARRSSI